jgi:phosphinothricin acetyltransferase
MADITIRRAFPTDAPTMLEVYRPYLATPITFEFDVPSEAEFTARIETICAAYPCLVCECDGVVAGYAYAHPLFERAAYQWDAELTIYLSESCCGQGAGTRLYHAMFDLLALQNVKAVYANVTATNDRSLTMHRALGFETVGEFPDAGFKDGHWYGIVFLRRTLGAFDPNPAPFRSIQTCDPSQIEQILERYR